MMEEHTKRTRNKILKILNSYPFTLLVVILIVFESSLHVAEVLIEQDIREKIVDECTEVKNFIQKLGQPQHDTVDTSSLMNNVIIATNNFLNVYDVTRRDNQSKCSHYSHASTEDDFVFTMDFTQDQNSNLCGTSSELGHFDISQVFTQADQFLQDLSHSFRIFALGIIIFMSVETSLRMFCTGFIFLKRKIEVFDAIIVFTSLIFDCSFYSRSFQKSSIVVMLLLPWRLIRIVSSLIAALNSKHRRQVKSLSIGKKKIEEKYIKIAKQFQVVKGNEDNLIKLCKLKGATSREINLCVYKGTSHMTVDPNCTIASMMLLGGSVNMSYGGNMIADSFREPQTMNKDPNNNDIDIANVTSKSSLSVYMRPSITDNHQSLQIPMSGNRSLHIPKSDNTSIHIPKCNNTSLQIPTSKKTRKQLTSKNTENISVIPKSSTPFLFPAPNFFSPSNFLTPFYLTTPLNTPQTVFFPDNFDSNLVRERLLNEGPSSQKEAKQQKLDVPDILITED
ncbi:uncharacterized protein [Mytilus edulis]|uniref:uncharacterized protein n=1 Tax=Mytilus edulis TaxID=6550 RepID=UPI0039F01FB0